MSMTRRQALLGGLSAAVTAPLIGMGLTTPAKVEAAKVPDQRKVAEKTDAERQLPPHHLYRPPHVDKLKDLLWRCGNPRRYDSEAMGELLEAAYPGMKTELLQQVQPVCYYQKEAGYTYNTTSIDCASSVDWLTKYNRDARFDVVARAFQLMITDIVGKVNEAKKPGSWISTFEVWDDPQLWQVNKGKRVGIYAWVELETPRC